MEHFYKHLDSPAGRLELVASDSGLVAVQWPDGKTSGLPAGARKVEEHPVLVQAQQQLSEYFRGERKAFDLPLDMRGTPFQQTVWRALQTIPYGETRSYGAIAAQVGKPKGTQAVGAANGKNPLAIVVPCHRVIGATGKLIGFTGGLQAKTHLLSLENPERR